ncbi:MAG TPA: ferredoxin--NADP reductase [Saprospiraceae bacterium]|nr:ferredoxin--NADP reductase [Saprospiraceae bacterium]
MEFHALKIKQITPETADTVTIELELPEHLRDAFAYKQGQHITVRIQEGDHELRRSYSMSSSPLEKNRLAVTVKKVRGGHVSVFLHDSLKPGDTLDIAAPEGRFYVPLDPEKRRTYYFFGAGSGITPLMSIIKTTLESEPMSSIFLLYGSRNEESIIFRDELERLSERYTGQLHVEHVISQPKKESSGGGLFGIFKKTTMNWLGKTGRITKKVANEFIDENLARGPESDCFYFICGPGDMTDTVKAALIGRGIEAKQIHTEHFVNAKHIPGEFADSGASGDGKRVIVHLKGQKVEIVVPPGATILDVLVKEKFDPPYSCTAGACSTCMAKLLNGKVSMEVCYALDDEEVKAGYILTCQSHPETDVVELTYDM